MATPDGNTEECSYLQISVAPTGYTFDGIMKEGEQYTFSAYVSSPKETIIKVDEVVKQITVGWNRIVHTFTASRKNLILVFFDPGSYYMWHTQLEAGNKATGYVQAEQDTDVQNIYVEGTTDINGGLLADYTVNPEGLAVGTGGNLYGAHSSFEQITDAVLYFMGNVTATQCTVSTDAAVDGVRSAKLQSGSSRTWVDFGDLKSGEGFVTTVVGEIYKITAYVKANASASVGMWVKSYNSIPNTVTDISSVKTDETRIDLQTVGTDWLRLSGDFSANGKYITVGFSVETANRTVYIDAIQVERVLSFDQMPSEYQQAVPDIYNGQNIIANTITAEQIMANTITAAEIAAGAITAEKIAVGAITAEKIAVGAIGMESLNQELQKAIEEAGGEDKDDSEAMKIIAEWCYNNDTTFIDGGKIFTGSISANRINVQDLSAFGATIGGMSINSNGIFTSNGTSDLNIRKDGSVESVVYIGADKRTSYHASLDGGEIKFELKGSNQAALRAYPYDVQIAYLGGGLKFGLYDRNNPSTYKEALEIGFRTFGNVDNAFVKINALNNKLVYAVGSYESETEEVSSIGAGASNTLKVYGRWGGTSLSGKTIVMTGSDKRLKDNVKDSQCDALSVINSIQLREFNWKDTGNFWKVGMIADELEKIDPLFVVGGDGPEDEISYKSVDTWYLQGFIVRSVQQLSDANRGLREELDELKKIVASLQESNKR